VPKAPGAGTDPLDERLHCRVLVDAGYEAVEAADGAVGLRLWHARGADLVLTDIEMPELNGIEVILELRTSC
jgi:CheY-like chemotaxis protein